MGNSEPSTVEKLKDCVALLREAVIVLVLILLLIFPKALNAILVKAGFTEASIAGFKWQKEFEDSVQDTKAAAETVSKLEMELENARAQLAQIQSTAPAPVQQQITTLSDRIGNSQIQAQAARRTIESSLQVQQSIVRRLPQTK